MENQLIDNFIPKLCIFCGCKIPLGESEKIFSYKRRKFCSTSCFNKYHRRKRKTNKNRICLNCGKDISSRKYCSPKCQQEHAQKLWEEKWIRGEVSGNDNSSWIDHSDRVRTYLFKKYNNKCSKCGWGEVNPFTGRIPLEVEHIDGNANNTTPDNVTLLCPNCHSLTSTYRGANRGKGRGKTWTPKNSG